MEHNNHCFHVQYFANNTLLIIEIGGASLMWWLIFALLGVSVFLASSSATDSKIKELERRVSELENSIKD